MAAHHRPTDGDRREAIEIVLTGLADGRQLGDIATKLALLHPPNNTFPAELLLELAADALDVAGASREAPLEFEGIRGRYLPEAVARTRAQHHKSEFALRAAAMIHGGVDPGLLDEVHGGAPTTSGTGRSKRSPSTSEPRRTAAVNRCQQ